MGVHLTAGDFILAAALAFFFTWLITNAGKIFKMVLSRPFESEYNEHDLAKVLQKCYILFPKEIVMFNGKTFLRGMNIRVITSQRKMYEGRLIGLNNENMLCVLTSKHLVAHELGAIDEMEMLENKNSPSI